MSISSPLSRCLESFQIKYSTFRNINLVVILVFSNLQSCLGKINTKSICSLFPRIVYIPQIHKQYQIYQFIFSILISPTFQVLFKFSKLKSTYFDRIQRPVAYISKSVCAQHYGCLSLGDLVKSTCQFLFLSAAYILQLCNFSCHGSSSRD